ncbi:MAG TPA: carbohydrate ABC transporter permease [Candidatus Eisenbergiella merdigallinarum]|uniref:Carbohydrate ABC transporter permease n=1 Tax=Candidatus Eisenbergiella merdigallinarum TaxID=2838552 RepID=A0A9D2MSH1_9FIRM|nr:carbohydrate ABC transporter permease [Candidatus Eisenbergiella merdigallinarum]
MKPVTVISQCIIWIIVIALTLSCLLPLLNMVAISLSGSNAVAANEVGLIPKDFNVSTYQKLLGDGQFWRSFLISIVRVVLGTAINMFFTVTMAYPLSKSHMRFRARDVYMKVVIFAMLFTGGIIPLFMVVSRLHMVNTIWALVLPGAVPVFNVILLINFFKSVPESLDEAARIDGASPLDILVKVYLPVSLPALATVALFAIVNHWNDYFTGLLYMSKADMYPLQTYIQQLTVDMTQITDANQLKQLASMNNRTFNATKIVVSTIPLLLIYPFLQKYFVSGIVIGAVKE